MTVLLRRPVAVIFFIFGDLNKTVHVHSLYIFFLLSFFHVKEIRVTFPICFVPLETFIHNPFYYGWKAPPTVKSSSTNPKKAHFKINFCGVQIGNKAVLTFFSKERMPLLTSITKLLGNAKIKIKIVPRSCVS